MTSPVLFRVAASIHLTAVFCHGGADSPRWTAGFDALHPLLEWLAANPLRPVIARSMVGQWPKEIGERDLGPILQTLRTQEADLLAQRSKDLDAARAIFRSEGLTLVRDLQKLRAESATIMGADFFRTLVAVAAAVAGLAVSGADRQLQTAAASAVALILFLASLIKAELSWREFERIVEFNKHFLTLPAASSVAEFQGWYLSSHNGSVREFAAIYVAGVTLGGLVLLGSAAAWGVSAGLKLVWGWSLAGAAAVGLATLLWAVRRRIRRTLVRGGSPKPAFAL